MSSVNQAGSFCILTQYILKKTFGIPNYVCTAEETFLIETIEHLIWNGGGQEDSLTSKYSQIAIDSLTAILPSVKEGT